MPATVTDRLQGLTTSVAVKAPVKAVFTTNIQLAGLQGGLSEGDRALVAGQSNPIDNGIYNASTSAWKRAADFDGARDVVNGTLVVQMLSNGTGALYQANGIDPILPGTSPITFALRDNPNITYPQTIAEIYAGVTPINYAYPVGNVFRFFTPAQVTSCLTAGTVGGQIDMTDAIQAANDFMEGNIIPGAGGQPHPGGRLFFPGGTYFINSTTPLRVGGHVRWVGDDDYSTQFSWNDTTGTGHCVEIGPDQSGFFAYSNIYTMYSGIEKIRFGLDPNNKHSVVIYAANAQDGSYIRDVSLYNVNQYGIDIEQPGDLFTGNNVVIYGGSLGGLPLPRVGIRCGDGATIAWHNILIAGGDGFTKGIHCRNGNWQIKNATFEACTDAIACVDTDTTNVIVTVDNVQGLSSCTNIVHIGTGYKGTVTITGLNGLTGDSAHPVGIKNDNTGESLLNTMVGLYSWSGDASGYQSGAFSYSAIHNTPHMRYGKSATQTIPQNTLTLLTFPTKQDDWLVSSQSEWSGSRYTPKIPGRYRVSVSISMASATWSAGTRLMLELQKTGTPYSLLENDTAVGTFTRQITFTDTVNCGVGEYIEAYVYQAAATNLNTDSSSATCFIAIDRE